jgi:hypothetical protein
MRKKITAVLLAGAFALSIPAAAAADNPHAGQSGHFKNNSNPCQNTEDHKKCPPFGN